VNAGLFAVDRRRLEGLSEHELVAKCARLSERWMARGMPNEEQMPREMLGLLVALRAERARRGEQGRLF